MTYVIGENEKKREYVTMDFELKDEDIRKIRNVAMAELRKEYYRWACWALDDGKFKGWAIDTINMGLAIAQSQLHK